jgi:hypothetical protein
VFAGAGGENGNARFNHCHRTLLNRKAAEVALRGVVSRKRIVRHPFAVTSKPVATPVRQLSRAKVIAILVASALGGQPEAVVAPTMIAAGAMFDVPDGNSSPEITIMSIWRRYTCHLSTDQQDKLWGQS